MGERSEGLLSAAETAARLGVKRETLYAYVSRGLLRRSPRGSGRVSWFEAHDVDRLLAERGGRRPAIPLRGALGERQGEPGLELSIASSVTTISDGHLRYRDHDLARLVGRISASPVGARPAGAPATSFETVAELLWSGRLPARRPQWSASPAVAVPTRHLLRELPPAARPADRLRVAAAAAAAVDPLRVDLRPPAVRATARSLLVVLAESLAPPVPSAAVDPRDGADGTAGASLGKRGDTRVASADAPLAERVAVALGAAPHWTGAIDTALVVLADHELATSTLAARVAASTRADPYQVVLAGLAAVSGPLHGSASGRVGRLLRAADGDAGPEPAIADQMRELGAVPGFGHALYPEGDPRAPLLLAAVRAVGGGGLHAIELADVVQAAVARRAAIAPNVDFALATLVLAARLPPDAGEALFALARCAGWLAHGLEEYAAPPLRYRLRATPTGPLGLRTPVVP